jgi:hypothetical protein
MQADSLTAAPGSGDPGITLTRTVLVLPLALGILGALYHAAVALTTSGQDALFYLASAAMSLAPGLLYAYAAFLVLAGRRSRPAWAVLLAVGVVLTGLSAYYLWQYREGGVLLVVPPYLVGLALVRRLWGTTPAAQRAAPE